MKNTDISIISNELNIKEKQVQAVSDLLAEGSTIPFIARYRKEKTGSLDEVDVTAIRDRIKQIEELFKRKKAIIKTLEKNSILTDDLQLKIESATDLQTLEDIYLPYKQKKKTRATKAKEKGLAPLAENILNQDNQDPELSAEKYINKDLGIENIQDAISGAKDIIAELISEDENVRLALRNLFSAKSIIKSSKSRKAEKEDSKNDEMSKYSNYYEWEEAAVTAPSHRILAMFRGENQGVLSLTVLPDEAMAIKIMEHIYIKGGSLKSGIVKEAIADSYKRLLSKSMENELKSALKDRADTEAIKKFSENLRQLLLLPPLGHKKIMGIDPGFRTGCKVVCLNESGKLLHHETIYPFASASKDPAAKSITSLCAEYDIEAIAIGNGTAGRETEAFIKGLSLPTEIKIVLVNESGASIYSASETARKEFPDLDLTVRGAVSIGRRLMDPLAELVKIDPKSIGVGQYQHDVNQTRLKQALDDVVTSCVNGVGVDLNSASRELLTYVSGIGPVLAENIINFRNASGSFNSRNDLKKVPRFGPKAFEQSAGFLRITNGKNILDSTAVHPESYSIVEKMAKDLNCETKDLIKNKTLRNKIDIQRYISDKAGLPTLKDILSELEKPGRDPRDTFEEFSFKQGINKIEDLETGMKLPGIVTNITAFGAFVDIGVHQDGLVHISQMADRFIKDPSEVVKLNQTVHVTVIDVDVKRKRISLSMKEGTR